MASSSKEKGYWEVVGETATSWTGVGAMAGGWVGGAGLVALGVGLGLFAPPLAVVAGVAAVGATVALLGTSAYNYYNQPDYDGTDETEGEKSTDQEQAVPDQIPYEDIKNCSGAARSTCEDGEKAIFKDYFRDLFCCVLESETPTEACTDGETKCSDDGTSIEKCENGEWLLEEECEEGFICENGECVPDEFCTEYGDDCYISASPCDEETEYTSEERDGQYCCCEDTFCQDQGCELVMDGECPEGTDPIGEREDGALCCCEKEEEECPDGSSPQPEPCEEGQEAGEITDPETGETIYCCKEEEEEECPECPDIAPAVQAKIAEIEGHMAQLAQDLEALLLTKEPIKEDLYQLYKVVMLKSLGYKQVFGYNSLLLEKRYYERGEIVIDTDREVSQIGKYTWDWSRWINNILYRIELGGRVIEENDSATFYLRMPESKKIIEDALRLAQEAKANDIQKIGKDIGVKKPLSQNIFQKVYSFVTGIFSGPGSKEILAQANQKKLQEYLDENNIDPATLSPNQLNEIIDNLGINMDQSQTLSVLQRLSPSEFLECNMEIPIGEVFELTWAHLIELLDTIDEYVAEGKKLIEQQAKMNELARPCDCPCEGDEECPDACGACELKCDLNAIRAAHQEVLKTREKMKEIAAHIELLTDGHFNTPTENLCDPLNEDVRDDEEKTLCAGGGEKLISKHELITRKLNYSRTRFDECITRPEQLEDVLEGKIAGKLPFFGPLLEEKGIPRYTKTVVGGSRVNTSDFNWFCCSDTKLEGK
jgi:hypothetical protein